MLYLSSSWTAVHYLVALAIAAVIGWLLTQPEELQPNRMKRILSSLVLLFCALYLLNEPVLRREDLATMSWAEAIWRGLVFSKYLVVLTALVLIWLAPLTHWVSVFSGFLMGGAAVREEMAPDCREDVRRLLAQPHLSFAESRQAIRALKLAERQESWRLEAALLMAQLWIKRGNYAAAYNRVRPLLNDPSLPSQFRIQAENLVEVARWKRFGLPGRWIERRLQPEPKLSVAVPVKPRQIGQRPRAGTKT